jgi:hypothetical protein
MQIGRIKILTCATLIFGALTAHAQTAQQADSAPRVLLTSSGSTLHSAANAGEMIREIDDPDNGDRWLLVRDASHPQGPGLMLLVSSARVVAAHSAPTTEMPAPIIRIGDRVVVEENTAIVNARIEGAAMAPASAGLAFNVRLSIGGQVVRAVAIAPGRASFEQETRR